MSQFELVVFDWDGTLVDSTGVITDAIQRSAADLGLPVPDRRLASHVIGLGLQDALRMAVPDLTAELMPAYLERYRHHYLQRDSSLLPFAGAQALLEALQAQGRQVAVATGKSRAGLDRALGQTGWHHFFTATRCADEGHPKPHPWMLHDLCEEIGVAPERTVMIGDTTHDLGMARSAGATGVGVLYGAHAAEELVALSPALLATDVAALQDWLLPRVAPKGTVGKGAAPRGKGGGAQ